NPIFTLEALLKFPSGSAGGASSLALGEGNFDLGLFLHSGHRGNNFQFSVSPGFLARFGGYSMAAVGGAAIQVMFAPGYLRAFVYGIYSFQDVRGFDSSTGTHDAPGSGGSYALLNASPIGISAGGKIGLSILKDLSLEFTGSKSLFGSKYPDFIRIGGDV